MAAAIAVVEETGLSRILVTDGAGLVLYDTRETGGAVGQYVLYTEIVQALLGNDAFSCTYEGGAFRSRASSPVLYQNQIIGAVYAYESVSYTHLVCREADALFPHCGAFDHQPGDAAGDSEPACV